MPVAGAVLCDVWHVGGDFETLIDCYLTPGDISETTVASAVAVRLQTELLLPDDTLDPSRFILAEPTGTLRPVHVDEEETDDGPQRRNLRPCTAADPDCAASRWPPAPAPGQEDYPGQLL